MFAATLALPLTWTRCSPRQSNLNPDSLQPCGGLLPLSVREVRLLVGPVSPDVIKGWEQAVTVTPYSCVPAPQF